MCIQLRRWAACQVKDGGRSLSRLRMLSEMTCRGLQEDSTENRDWLSALTGSLMTLPLNHNAVQVQNGGAYTNRSSNTHSLEQRHESVLYILYQCFDQTHCRSPTYSSTILISLPEIGCQESTLAFTMLPWFNVRHCRTEKWWARRRNTILDTLLATYSECIRPPIIIFPINNKFYSTIPCAPESCTYWQSIRLILAYLFTCLYF